MAVQQPSPNFRQVPVVRSATPAVGQGSSAAAVRPSGDTWKLSDVTGCASHTHLGDARVFQAVAANHRVPRGIGGRLVAADVDPRRPVLRVGHTSRAKPSAIRRSPPPSQSMA